MDWHQLRAGPSDCCLVRHYYVFPPIARPRSGAVSFLFQQALGPRWKPRSRLASGRRGIDRAQGSGVRESESAVGEPKIRKQRRGKPPAFCKALIFRQARAQGQGNAKPQIPGRGRRLLSTRALHGFLQSQLSLHPTFGWSAELTAWSLRRSQSHSPRCQLLDLALRSPGGQPGPGSGHYQRFDNDGRAFGCGLCVGGYSVPQNAPFTRSLLLAAASCCGLTRSYRLSCGHLFLSKIVLRFLVL
jgi:hypothetical protein